MPTPKGVRRRGKEGESSGIPPLFRPFIDAGAGGRMYHYDAQLVDNNTCTVGYGSFGSELQYSAFALRLEGRAMANCYTSPITGVKSTRQDMGYTFGIAYHLR